MMPRDNEDNSNNNARALDQFMANAVPVVPMPAHLAPMPNNDDPIIVLLPAAIAVVVAIIPFIGPLANKYLGV